MALPHWAYGDPAQLAERAELKQKKCAACARAVVVLGRYACPAGLRFPDCRQDKKKGFVLLEGARQ